MTTTVPTHGGPAVPASIVTDGKTMGRVATRVYGFTSAAEAAAAGYKCEAGPASSVYVVSAAELASGKFVAEGDPKAIPMYAAPAGMKVEAGYAQPIVIVGGGLSVAGGEPFPLNLFPKTTQSYIEFTQFGAYRVVQPLNSDLYNVMNFSGVYSIGGAWMRLGGKSSCRLWAGRAIDHASVTKAGSWATTVNSSYFTGRYSTSITNGAYVQIVTDDGVTAVGMYFLGNGNGTTGFNVVSIDGDNTLATLIKTAQEVVDAGVLPNTVLVANGGTLNPTDRIFDNEGGAVGVPNPVIFTRSLAAGVHTIRVSRTCYKRAASSATNLFFCGFITYGAGLYNPATQTYRYFDQINVIMNNGADEVSWFFQPTGTTAGAWLGHTGSATIKTLPVITVDGVDRSTALTTRNTIYSGSSIVITTQNDVIHPETGATSHGIFDLVYTFNQNGMDIYHKTAWSDTGTVYGFPCMLTVENALFDRCADAAGTWSIVKDGNNHINTATNAIWFFDSDGNLATVMSIYDLALTVNNWATAGTQKLYCWDNNATFAKGYANRFDIAHKLSYTNATVFESRANYRVGWLPGGTAGLIV